DSFEHLDPRLPAESAERRSRDPRGDRDGHLPLLSPQHLAFAVDRRQALAVGGGDGDLDLRALAAQLGEDSGAEFVEPALLDGGGEDDVAFEAAARVLPELGLLLVREAVDLVEYQ